MLYISSVEFSLPSTEYTVLAEVFVADWRGDGWSVTCERMNCELNRKRPKNEKFVEIHPPPRKDK